ncbi:MAG: dTDP-glucose 4,6-dehydratase [Candidatus Xenobia bacterium]
MSVPPRMLVTGGAGFIGSNFVHLMRRLHPETRLIVLDKLTYAGNLSNLDPVKDDIEIVIGDIADPTVVKDAMAGVEEVVHFAAESHVDRSLEDGIPFVRTNVEGTLVLLEQARKAGVRRFLHVSTDEVYGALPSDATPSLESDPFHPSSPYAASKAGGEHLALSYFISFGMDVVITRGSNSYGPYQFPEKIIPLFIARAMNDQPLPVYGKGQALRDYLHVEDHCRAIELVLRQGQAGHAYNVGAREQRNGVEMATRILDALGKPHSLLQYVTDRPGHDYRYEVNPSKTEALGWTRRWNFEQGLEDTVHWYRDNRTWWERLVAAAR